MVVLVLVAGTAAAEELPGGIKIALDGTELVATAGGVTVMLPRGPYAGQVNGLAKVSLAKDLVKVAYDGCQGEMEAIFALGEIRARVENSKAYVLFRKKDYAQAAAGFRKAIELWPDFDLAYDNLASALALQGKKKDAVAALAPYAQVNPAWVAWRLVVDGDLAAIRDAPELTSIVRGSKPGTATIGKLVDDVIAWEPKRSLGAGISEQLTMGPPARELDVFTIPGGHIVLRLPLVEFGDYDDQCHEDGCPLKKAAKGKIAQREKDADQVLKDLGFVIDADSVGKKEAGSPLKVSWPKAKLHFEDGVVTNAAGKEIGKDEGLAHVRNVTLLSQWVVAAWVYQGGEACAGVQPVMFDVIPISR
jgi:hypothetical protein